MDFDILYNKIKEYDTICIFGHVRPDGDCYGSLNGLKNIIMTSFQRKRVFCLTAHVESLSFVGRMDDVDDDVFDNALAIVCDTSTRDRVYDKRYKLCKEVIKLDHHVIIDNYGDYNGTITVKIHDIIALNIDDEETSSINLLRKSK